MKERKEVSIKLFDSICHLDFPVFDKERDSIIERMSSVGIEGILVAGVTQNGWRNIRQLAASQPKIYSAVGLHPSYTAEHSKKNIRDLELAVGIKPLWAIGEIGLDYYDDKHDRKEQIDLFSTQVQIAKLAKLPIILHVRKAHEDVLLNLKSLDFKEGGIVHAFNGSMQQAQRYIELGFKLSFGGVISYPNATRLREMAKNLPLDAMVLETNAPDMKPKNCKNEYNTPFQIFDVFHEICELREESPEDIAAMTLKNSKTILKIDG